MADWRGAAGTAAVLLCFVTGAALAQTPAPASPTVPAAPTDSPPDAQLYFIAPTNGAVVRNPVRVQFGLKNMGVTQAGNAFPNAGHHHLLIDVKAPLDTRVPIPADKQHLHFGGGETETTLDLAPGRHTLRLVLGDAYHRPFLPIVSSETITITVASPAPRRPIRRRPRY